MYRNSACAPAPPSPVIMPALFDIVRSGHTFSRVGEQGLLERGAQCTAKLFSRQELALKLRRMHG